MTWKRGGIPSVFLAFLYADRRTYKHGYRPSYTYRELFNNQAEHNQWMVAVDRKGLSNFLLPTINKDKLSGVKTPHGYAALQHCGRIDTTKLISTYKTSIQSSLSNGTFDYAALETKADGVRYKDFKAKYIVFARLRHGESILTLINFFAGSKRANINY